MLALDCPSFFDLTINTDQLSKYEEVAEMKVKKSLHKKRRRW